MKKDKLFTILIALVFVGMGIGARLLPHLPNFTPVMAVGLFGGAYFSKKLSFFLPFAIMLASDFFIGFYDIRLMVFVYGAVACFVLIGFNLKKNRKWGNIMANSLLASFIFFVVTNFAVWIFSDWYPKNIFGLFQCFYLALPFFKNSLLGDIFYSSMFFGVFKSAEFLFEKLQHKIAVDTR